MLKLTRKQYEIDEKVVYDNEEGEVLYEFRIQLTKEELNKVKKMIFDEKIQEKVQKLSQLQTDGKLDELSELNKEIDEESKQILEEFEDIVYKEHKEPFKKVAGNDYYEAMTEKIYSFFTMKFLNERLELPSTMNSSLRKAGMK